MRTKYYPNERAGSPKYEARTYHPNYTIPITTSFKVMLEQYDYPDLLQEITLRIVERLRQQNYQNLIISNQPLPVPVSEDFTHYKRRFTSGLVLEISADPMGYGFMYLASNWQTYQPTISAQTRLIRLNDMKVLWQGKSPPIPAKIQA